MIVSNASPLIVLGKVGQLQLLKACFERIIIPPAVVEEVLAQAESAEALALRQGIADGWILTEKVKPLLRTAVMGKGETEAISLAAKKKYRLLLDDDTAKAYATLSGVEAHGMLYVLLLAVKKKKISRDEAKDILQQMILSGFYISTEIYARFVDLLDKL